MTPQEQFVEYCIRRDCIGVESQINHFKMGNMPPKEQFIESCKKGYTQTVESLLQQGVPT